MGRLDQPHSRIVQKRTERQAQEIRRRDVIGIEDRDELTLRAFERVIDVAGFGVHVVLACQITDADGRGEVAKVVARMYIELGRGRQDGDRLTRISDGSNVFESMNSLVSDYIGDERKRVRWAFVGEQGGARS